MKGLNIRLRQTEHERAGKLLSAYLDERVNAREYTLVQKHLETCQDCQDDLATLRATMQALHAMPAIQLPRSFTLSRSMARQPRPMWISPLFRNAMAATAAVCTIIVVGYLVSLNTSLWSNQATQPQPLSVAMDNTTPDTETLASTDIAPAEKAMPASPEATMPARAELVPPVEAPLGAGGVGGGIGGGMGGDAPDATATSEIELMYAEPTATGQASPEAAMSTLTTPTSTQQMPPAAPQPTTALAAANDSATPEGKGADTLPAFTIYLPMLIREQP